MERWQKPEAEPHLDHPCRRSSLDYNTPLRSIIRGDAAAAAPSPFYKLSAELSRESLRIPGAVPFMWEHSPGRRKFASTFTHDLHPQAGPSSSSTECSSSATVANPAKQNLASLLRQPSLKTVPPTADSWLIPPFASPDLPQISPPPSADQPRSSSARYSVAMQRKVPSRSSFHIASVHDNADDVVGTLQSDGEDESDTVTAMAGDGLSTMDDSLLLSGPLRPASTPSEARDFIMNRFLPAAHTIACESPQTPSRRFVPPAGVAGGPDNPGTSARSNGSFRDHAATSSMTACRPSPLRYASASSTPASYAMQLHCKGQQCAGSFHVRTEEEDEDDEDEDAEEDAPFTSKACGIFPFHLNLTLRRTTHKSSSLKHPNIIKQQHQKKLGAKSPHYTGTRTRIMDILRDDQSSSHGDESPVHPLQILKQLEAERERNKIAVFERNGLTYPSISPRTSRPRLLDSPNYRESPDSYQSRRAASELYSEEASEHSSFQDAPSRFQSPSPAALQHVNARTSRAYNGLQPPLVSSQRSLSFAGLRDGHPYSAGIISTTEQHLLNSSFYYYNMHSSIKKPHHQAQLPSPCAYHTPLASRVGASPHQSYAYLHDCNGSILSYNHDTPNIKHLDQNPMHHELPSNPEQWDTQCHSTFTQKTHIINNALYEHEDSEIVNVNSSCMLSGIGAHAAAYPRNGTRLQKQGTSERMEAGNGGCRYEYGDGGLCMNKDADHISKSDQSSSRDPCENKEGTDQCVSKEEHGIGSDDHQGDHVSNGNHHGNDGVPQGDGAYEGNDHQYNASPEDSSDVINYGDNHGGIFKSLLSPPLPKSPTHSWLDRAMPLLQASATNKSQLGVSSRLSHMHKAASASAPAEYQLSSAGPVSMIKPRKQTAAAAPISAAEASKWEALVRGSHRQSGHLRFSEELFNQSQSMAKVVAN